jgi:N-glycosylase/DNA lyase
MTTVRKVPWRKLPITLAELCLDTTLRCGQSFRCESPHRFEMIIADSFERWRKSEDSTWSCALHGRILCLKQDTTYLHYRAIFPETPTAPPTPPSSRSSSSNNHHLDEDDTEELVRHYLNLGPNLTCLYEQWSLADLNFKKKAPKFAGIRVLKQDAWEALVGFICSSNNNIIRISQMVLNPKDSGLIMC